MAIGGAQLNKYNYEESQRPILEQRATGIYDQNMKIGAGQIKQQELTADAFAKEHGWKEEDYNRKKAEYNAANWAKVQGEGGLDFIHNAINGADKKANIEAFNKQGTPILYYTVNSDGSITTVLPNEFGGLGEEKTINPYQVGAALDYRMGIKTLERKQQGEINKEKREDRKLDISEIGATGKITDKQDAKILNLQKAYNSLAAAKLKAQTSGYGKGADTTDIDEAMASLKLQYETLKNQQLQRTELPSMEELAARRQQRDAIGGRATSAQGKEQPVSQDIKDGIEWINKNPNDPRTEAIRKKFRELGVIGI
jgi:hypothetical protein